MTAPDARQNDELRGLIAEALADHRGLPLRISAVAFPGCTCGWLYPAETPGDLRMLAWQEHRADALLPVVTAWHEKAAEAQARARAAEELRAAATEVMQQHGTASLAAKRIRTRAVALDADARTTPA